MKRVLGIAVVLFCLFGGFFSACTNTTTTGTGVAAPRWALIEKPDVLLLENASAPSLENVYFTLPKDYFVEIIDLDIKPGFHYVRYQDILGYVQSENVKLQKIDFVPKSKYPPEVTLKVLKDVPAPLYLHPTNRDGSPISIVSSEFELFYYNTVIVKGNAVGAGTVAGDNEKLWYYVRQTDGKRSGFLLSNLVEDVTKTIPPNTDTSVAPGDNPPAESGRKTNAVEVIAILALCVPAALIVILIFARPKRTNAESAPSDENKKFFS